MPPDAAYDLPGMIPPFIVTFVILGTAFLLSGGIHGWRWLMLIFFPAVAAWTLKDHGWK